MKIIRERIPDKKPDAIFTTDWHLRDDTPLCREEEEFFSAMIRKVRSVVSTANAFNVPIIHCGDIGHRSQWSNNLLREILYYLGNLQQKLFLIPGQHDLPEHNIENWNKSAIGVLHEAGVVEVIPRFDVKLFKNFHLFCFPYGTPLNNEVLLVERDKKRVAITHQLIFEGQAEFPTKEPSSAPIILQENNNYDAIFSGDNHTQFMVEDFDTRQILVNPGSMLRIKSNQANHLPAYYLYYAKENRVEKRLFPIVRHAVNQTAQEVKLTSIPKDFRVAVEEYIEKILSSTTSDDPLDELLLRLETLARTKEVKRGTMDKIKKAVSQFRKES